MGVDSSYARPVLKKPNVWFIDSLTLLLYCKGHNSLIQSSIEAHEYLIEIPNGFSNGSSPTFVSRWQEVPKSSQTCCCCLCRVSCHLLSGLGTSNNHPWNINPMWSTPQGCLGRPLLGHLMLLRHRHWSYYCILCCSQF